MPLRDVGRFTSSFDLEEHKYNYHCELTVARCKNFGIEPHVPVDKLIQISNVASILSAMFHGAGCFLSVLCMVMRVVL